MNDAKPLHKGPLSKVGRTLFCLFFLFVLDKFFLTLAINFACVFYCNHVSLLGPDSCVAAGFTVIPVETTHCEEEHKAREQTALPVYCAEVISSMMLQILGTMFVYVFKDLLSLTCRTNVIFKLEMAINSGSKPVKKKKL